MRIGLNIGKKGYMKTIEVFMAILVAFGFLLVIIPREVPIVEDQAVYRLKNLEYNDDFRNCIISSSCDCNGCSCIDSIVSDLLGGQFSFAYDIDGVCNPELSSDSDVMQYSWYFAGNHTLYSPVVFRLYYWSIDIR